MAKKKRKVGERAEILIDTIDLKILNILEQYAYMGVLELAKRLNIQHKNLKPHLEKLIKVGLVGVSSSDKTRKLSLINIGVIDYDSETPKSIIANIKRAKEFHEKLKEFGVIDFQKKTLFELSKELNKNLK